MREALTRMRKRRCLSLKLPHYFLCTTKEAKANNINYKVGETMSELSCDTCANNVYDDEYGGYVCLVNMDEDEYYRLMSEGMNKCPYYTADDDYFLARKQ